MGSGISKKQIPSFDSMMHAMQDSTSAFDFEQFKALIKPDAGVCTNDEIILREWFRLLDMNGNGAIEQAEIDRAKDLISRQQKATPTDADAFRLLDLVPLGDRTAAHRFLFVQHPTAMPII